MTMAHITLFVKDHPCMLVHSYHRGLRIKVEEEEIEHKKKVFSYF